MSVFSKVAYLYLGFGIYGLIIKDFVDRKSDP